MRVLGVICAALMVCACSTTTSSSTLADNSKVIARVGSQVIRQHALDVRLQSTLTALRQGGAQTPSGPSDPMLQQLRANIVRSLISDAVIAQEAQYRHVAVNDAHVDAAVRQDQADAGGEQKLTAQLAQAGGSMDQLRDEIRSHDNEQNLEEYFAKQRAESAISELRGGATFASVAARYDDDAKSAAHGGDAGVLTRQVLDSSDPDFARAVEGLSVGATTSSPVRDQAGYEVLRLDAHQGSNWSVHRILVSAPRTYTVMNRPQWFTQSLLDALAQLCGAHQVTVYIDSSIQPCTAPPTPAR